MRGVIAALGLAACVVTATAGQGPVGSHGTAIAQAASPPNVVVIHTDDQDFASQRFMRTVNRTIGDRGATFRNSFTNTALCCPSRATFLSGQYAFNHGVLTNRSPSGGYTALHPGPPLLPEWLSDAGYHTAMVGKYLNGYAAEPQPETVPPGWTSWQATTTRGSYYDWQFNANGERLVDRGGKAGDFLTDVQTRQARRAILEAPPDSPFFLWLNYYAPHAGGRERSRLSPRRCAPHAKPAARHAFDFRDAPLPMPPSFNEDDRSDKPAAVRDRPPLTRVAIQKLERNYRCRLGSLRAVDEGVGDVIRTLKQSGDLDDTYVIFTSDNGYYLGEHAIAQGKALPYEPGIRVPLLIRGPGIPPGVEVSELVVNADLAPTIAEATNVSPGRAMDGRSLLNLAGEPGRELGRELLIQANRPRFTAIRNHRYLYAEYANTGERELYDLKRDPHELRNAVDDGDYAEVASLLSRRLADLRACAGESCRTEPEMELELRGVPGTRDGCLSAPIDARVDATDDIDSALFTANGSKIGRVRTAPFEARLPEGAVGGGVVEVTALTSLVDGRRASREASAQVCRR